MDQKKPMLFSKRMLMTITPIGVAIGLHEAWRLAGGMVLLVGAQILLLGIAGFAVVRRIKEEQR